MIRDPEGAQPQARDTSLHALMQAYCVSPQNPQSRIEGRKGDHLWGTQSPISQPLNENNNTTNNFLNTCFVHLLCAQLPLKPQLLFPTPCWAAGIIPISQMRL